LESFDGSFRFYVSDEELSRRANWRAPAARYTRDVLAMYAKLVSSSTSRDRFIGHAQ
jgi:hypothetical protein